MGTDRETVLGCSQWVVDIRRRDGVHFDLDRLVVADARSSTGDVNVVSHAHTDHLLRRDGAVVCSRETAAIAAARSGRSYEPLDVPGIRLVPAGHVVGSRAAIITGCDGRRYCYTGDFSIRDRGPLEGFDPTTIDVDVLVLETTYGRPTYTFPPQEDLEAAIADWFVDNADRPLVCFGYVLGRAQMLEWLADRATNREVLVTPDIGAIDAAIETATDGVVSLPGRVREPETLRSLEDAIVVTPGTQANEAWVERLQSDQDARTGAFSGWAIEDSYRYRRGTDVAFPLTDHCGHDELLETVQAIDPERVYTHHGFAVEFADELATEHGYDARALLRRQATLSDFR